MFKHNEYYEINILLNNGDTFKNKFSSKFSNEKTILINQIKQKIFDFKIKKQSTELLHTNTDKKINSLTFFLMCM